MASGKKRRQRGRKSGGQNAQHPRRSSSGGVKSADQTSKEVRRSRGDDPIGYTEQGFTSAAGHAIAAGAPVYKVSDEDLPAAVAAAREAGYEIPAGLRRRAAKGETSVIIQHGGDEKPAGATRLLGVLNEDGITADGSVVPAGSKVWASNETPDRMRARLGAGQSTVMTFSGGTDRFPLRLRVVDEGTQRSGPARAPGMTKVDIGKPAPLGQSRTAVGDVSSVDQDMAMQVRHHGQPGRKRPGRRVPLIPPEYSSATNQAFAGQTDPALAGTNIPEEILARMARSSPGLAERLGQGLTKHELAEMAPVIAKAMQDAGAESGTYTFTGRGERPAEGEDLPEGWHLRHEPPADPETRHEIRQPGGPSLIVTDDMSAIPDGAADLVIEDLDPEMDDEGRILIGSQAQIRAYHQRAAELDERVRKYRRSEGRPPGSQADAEAIMVQTAWNADSVLDQLAWLVHHYRKPSDLLADYLAYHIRDSQEQDSRATAHYYPIDLTGGPADIPEGRQLAQLLAKGLGDAEPYQVTGPMCTQMRDLFDLNKDQIPLRLSEGELPAPAGFAWLDRPWLLHLGGGYWLPVRAVSWDCTSRPVAGENGVLARWVDCVRVTMWLLLADESAFRRWEGGDDQARTDKMANQIGRLVPQSIELMPFDMELTPSPRFREQAAQVLGLLHILWMYLGTELPKSRPVVPAAPAVRKRVARTLKHDRIHIITLRKFSYIGDPLPRFPRLVNWSCRWDVKEHHRHIDEYDDGTDEKGRRRRHKAKPASRVGAVLDDDHDICGVCLANGQTVRITLVHGPYWKGPTNKPIRVKDRTLNRLSR